MRILRWHKLEQLILACLYIFVIPFLIIFILHGTQPYFEWCHTGMLALIYGITACFVGRVVCAMAIKYKVWVWERKNGRKFSNKQLMQLM
jgi:hypothetical protein